MFKKFLVSLLLVNVALFAEGEMSESGMLPEFKSKKCKTFKNLNVCNNLNVGGTVTANNFVSTSGQLFGGIRNYAILTNQATIDSGTNILWAETPAANLSSGISFDPTTGLVTLPTSGLFLVQYTVRFTRTPFDGTSVATAQLQQTISGTPVDITQPAIVNFVGIDGISDVIPSSDVLVTGYALVTVTSSANNVINLITFYDNNTTLPAATAADANAEMVILQLN